MSRSGCRGRRAVPRACARRFPLVLEALEDRHLLDAGVGSLMGSSAYDSGDILVRLRPEFAGITKFTPSGNETGSPSLLAAGLWRVDLPPGVTVADALASFRVDPRVDFAQPDYRIHVQLAPNDPYFAGNFQWALTKIGAPAAWSHTTGSSNVIVAVIDSGIDFTNPDLAANIWTNTREIAGNGRDDDGDGIIDDLHGANFTGLTATTGYARDDNNHGTHVAGIIGAVGNNGVGVSGVDWHVRLMALKFLDANGNGYTSGAVRAIDYAIAHGASMINASWGGGGFDQALSDAIGRAQQAGVIFVAAAGNSGTNNDSSPFYPAGYQYDNVVSVAASDSSDNRASFSNWGPRTVDVYAPGVGIWSTVRNSGYASYSGTSMAAPFVTGALALLKSEHPDWNYHQLIDRLRTTVDHVPGMGNVAWRGRLDVAAALADTTPPVNNRHPTILSATASQPGQGPLYKLRLVFNETVDSASFTARDVALSGPNGGIAISGVAAVPGSGNTQFDVMFVSQTAPGIYRLSVGPRIRDLDGNEMAAAFTASFAIRGASTTYHSGALNIGVLDFHTATSTINIPDGVAVGKVTVNVNVDHTWVGDLVIKLRAPDGTTVTLFNRQGGSGHNLRATFDDAAAVSIGAGAAPFQGSFRPGEALAALNGANARGAWQLIVQDRAAGDQGTLTGWSLTIQPAASSQKARRSSFESAAIPTQVSSAVIDTLFARALVPCLRVPNVDSALIDMSQGLVPGKHLSGNAAARTLSDHRTVDQCFTLDGGGSEAPDASVSFNLEGTSSDDELIALDV